MHARLFLTFLLAGFVTVLQAAEQAQQASVIQIDHQKVSAAFATGGPLLVTNNFKIQAGHRTGAGEVEVHERDTDIFYITEGSATFVTGGKAVDLKTTSSGELRGKEIAGGDERHLTKGDVIVIPNGIPHWFKAVDGKFDYFVVKVTK